MLKSDTKQIKDKVIGRLRMIIPIISDMFGDAMKAQCQVVVTFLQEATDREIRTIWSNLDRAGTHLVRAYKAAMKAWGPAKDIIDRTDKALSESEVIQKIEERLEENAEEAAEHAEAIASIFDGVSLESQAMREFQTNGQATSDEMEMIAYLQDAAGQHGLEAEVMATYTKKRANGYAPADAQQIAISEWDL